MVAPETRCQRGEPLRPQIAGRRPPHESPRIGRLVRAEEAVEQPRTREDEGSVIPTPFRLAPPGNQFQPAGLKIDQGNAVHQVAPPASDPEFANGESAVRRELDGAGAHHVGRRRPIGGDIQRRQHKAGNGEGFGGRPAGASGSPLRFSFGSAAKRPYPARNEKRGHQQQFPDLQPARGKRREGLRQFYEVRRRREPHVMERRHGVHGKRHDGGNRYPRHGACGRGRPRAGPDGEPEDIERQQHASHAGLVHQLECPGVIAVRLCIGPRPLRDPPCVGAHHSHDNDKMCEAQQQLGAPDPAPPDGKGVQERIQPRGALAHQETDVGQQRHKWREEQQQLAGHVVECVRVPAHEHNG